MLNVLRTIEHSHTLSLIHTPTPLVCSVEDQWSTGRARPTRDAQQDVRLLSASQVGNTTTYVWTRALTTGDTAGDVAITAGANPMVFAWVSAAHVVLLYNFLHVGQYTHSCSSMVCARVYY